MVRCGAPMAVPMLVDLETADGSVVTYDRVVHNTETVLVRRSCDPTGQIVNESIVSHHLGTVRPVATCDGTTCAPGSSPRRVQLVVTETSGFEFTLIGFRRADTGAVRLRPAHYTVARRGSDHDGGSDAHYGGSDDYGGSDTTAAPTPSARLVILKNASKVVTVSGGSVITVRGDAEIGSTAPDWLNGPASGFSVTGTTTTGSVTDPYASLSAPDEAGLPVYTDGAYHGPGVYRTKALTIGSPTTFAPGIYILEDGFTVPGGNRVTGTNVLLFNGCGLNAPPSCTGKGKISISGGSTADLTALTSGPFAGILFFQDRANTQVVTVSGGSLVTALSGALYAPNSSKITLGSGGSTLSISQVVGQVVEASGGSQITVGP